MPGPAVPVEPGPLGVIAVHDGLKEPTIRKGVAIGERDAWHRLALAWAILSTLPEADVREPCLGRVPVDPTRRTLTTVRRLIDDLGEVRRRGFAVDDERSASGLRCVADS